MNAGCMKGWGVACVEVEGRSKLVRRDGEATPRSQHESPGQLATKATNVSVGMAVAV